MFSNTSRIKKMFWRTSSYLSSVRARRNAAFIYNDFTDKDARVARALFLLNRYYRKVGRSSEKNTFYELKSAVIREFVDRGYMVGCEIHRKEINKIIDYYLVSFFVDGEHYEWHQPLKGNSYLSAYADNNGDIQPLKWNRDAMKPMFTNADRLALNWMLALYTGKESLLSKSLLQSIRQDLTPILFRLKYRILNSRITKNDIPF